MKKNTTRKTLLAFQRFSWVVWLIQFGRKKKISMLLLREYFPILLQSIKGKPLIYLDNGATTQKPKIVIDSQAGYYRCCSSNIHRGNYDLAVFGDYLVECARKTAREFINAKEVYEVIFTAGTTAGINLVASSFGETYLKQGDEIVVTQMEHHSNLVPWQVVARKHGAVLRYIPMTTEGDLDLERYKEILNPKTRIVAVVHVSNALGTINPVEEIIRLAHEAGAKVLVDGAQSLAHLPIDVQKMDCDFYVCSGHKAYGPQGIGFLYGKEALLREMLPYQLGGDMIREVTMEDTTYADLPNKFEAGTPNIAGIVGFGVALNFIRSVGIEEIYRHEKELLDYATGRLLEIQGLRIYGNSRNKLGVISFNIDDHDHNDLAIKLNNYGICVRNGQHCTHPIMTFYGISGTVRATFACYNTKHDVDQLVTALTAIINEE